MSSDILVIGLCFVVIFTQVAYAIAEDVDKDSCQRNRFALDEKNFNKRMAGHVVFNLSTTHHQCIRGCMQLSVCESTNYITNFCELNDMNSTTASQDIETVKGYIYTDIAVWPKNWVGNCGKRPCKRHQMCVPTEPLVTCLNIDCGKPYILFSVLNDTSTVYGSVVEVTCKQGLHITGQSIIKCGIDGQWSEKPVCKVKDCGKPNILFSALNDSSTTSGSTVEVSCQRGFTLIGQSIIECTDDGLWSEKPICTGPATCKEVKDCNKIYTHDDTFWLFSSAGNVWLKVFCFDMDGDEPKEYLTVNPTTNYIEDTGNENRNLAGAAVSFEKIRLFIKNMTIDQRDVTFASLKTVHTISSGTDLLYGMAAGCNGSDVLGRFSIDISGTALSVDKTIEWELRGRSINQLLLTRSVDGTRISGSCGGRCASCQPSSPLLLHFYHEDIVGEGVTSPYCENDKT